MSFIDSPIELAVLSEFTHLSPAEQQATFVARVVPPPAAGRRPPVRLVLALDTSGSMDGEKMDRATRSAVAISQILSADDSFACVTFDSRVSVLVPPTPMTQQNREKVQRTLGRTRADPAGMTDLAGGMLKALEVAAARPSGRVLLLTDGCPTEGVTDEGQILRLLRGACRGSTLSSFGFGRDVNPHLLQGLADAGQGNYSFVEANEPPVAAIAGEVGGALLTVAAGVGLTIAPAPSVKLRAVYRAGLPAPPESGPFTVNLPPLVAEEPVAVVFELSWDKGALGPLAELSLSARRTDTGEEVRLLARVFRALASGKGPLDPLAAREIVLARAAVALHLAGRAAPRDTRQACQGLLQLKGELGGIVHAAGLAEDSQVAAALQMMADAARDLESAPAARGRHDIVAAAAAVQGRRTTRGLSVAPVPPEDADGPESAQARLTSPSQRFGLEQLHKFFGLNRGGARPPRDTPVKGNPRSPGDPPREPADEDDPGGDPRRKR